MRWRAVQKVVVENRHEIWTEFCAGCCGENEELKGDSPYRKTQLLFANIRWKKNTTSQKGCTLHILRDLTSKGFMQTWPSHLGVVALASTTEGHACSLPACQAWRQSFKKLSPRQPIIAGMTPCYLEGIWWHPTLQEGSFFSKWNNRFLRGSR